MKRHLAACYFNGREEKYSRFLPCICDDEELTERQEGRLEGIRECVEFLRIMPWKTGVTPKDAADEIEKLLKGSDENI